MTRAFFSSRLLLMPFYRPETKFYIYIFVFIFFACLVGFLGYTYFRVQEIDKEGQTETFPIKREILDQQLLNIIAKEKIDFPVEETEVDNSCRLVPIEENVSPANLEWKRVSLMTKEEYARGSGKFYNLFFEGELLSFGEFNSNNCLYYQLNIDVKGNRYVINVPRGVNFTGIFKDVSPEFLKNYPGSWLKLRVKYFSEEGKKFVDVELIGWEIENIKPKNE